MDALAGAIARLAEARELSAAVITGSVVAFAAGAEIGEVARLTPASAFDFSRHGQAALGAIASCEKPVVAAVRGYCIGADWTWRWLATRGSLLADAVFAHPGVMLGIITGWGGTQRLSRLIGRGRALEMFVTGGRIGAEQALAWGLVNEISTSDDLMAAAIRMARGLAR